ncbi:MAG: DUF3333 domain-containing protein, partial [Paracoccus sp. (in: a-proteobacteria)]|nr:DUF3333 domain-containing protein [Paracoccus sp. (in: a-proteobacteria)]
MTDMPIEPARQPAPNSGSGSLLKKDARTRRRNAAEGRFRFYGLAAIGIAVLALIILVTTILRDGSSAFRQTYLDLPVYLNPEVIDPNGNRDPAEMAKVLTLAYSRVLDSSLDTAVAGMNLNIEGLTERDIDGIVSREAAAQLRDRVLSDPELVGQTVDVNVLVNGRVDGYFKGRVTMASAERDSNTSPAQLMLADELKRSGLLVTR